MAPRVRFELTRDKAHWLAWLQSPQDTGFQDQRRNPGLATSAQHCNRLETPFKLLVELSAREE
jgi:hypothetical protein